MKLKNKEKQERTHQFGMWEHPSSKTIEDY